jgi:folate-binding protein YgfZ
MSATSLRTSPLHPLHEREGASFTAFQGWDVVRSHGDVTQERLAARSGVAVADLSAFGRIWVRGRDAMDYLHRRLTNSVKNRAVGEGCRAALLTGTGRMIADFSLHGTGDAEFLLIAAPSCAEALAADLEKFIFSEDCLVAVSPEGSGLLAVFGPEAARVIENTVGPGVSGTPLWGCARGVFRGAEIPTVRSSLMGPPGFFLAPESDQIEALWESLTSAGTVPLGFEALGALRIEAGVPLFGQDHDSKWIPPDAGLDEGVIDYTKGCFPGQEVVAKIHNLSHPHTALRGFILSASQPPLPGAGLFNDEGHVGDLTSLCVSPSLGRVIGLGHLKWQRRDAGQTLRVGESGEHGTAEVVELPFRSFQD